jgi:hypothetical protein
MLQRSSLFRSASVLFLVSFGAAGMAYYHLAIFIPRAIEIRAIQNLGNGYSFGADFYPLWLTAREGLHHHRDPYSPETTREIQIGLFGRPLNAQHSAVTQDPRSFANPAFTELLFWPLALIPFTVVRVGLVVILCTVTALSIVLWLRTLSLRAGGMTLTTLILLTLSSYAVLEGLFAEQIGLLIGFLLAASLSALVRQRLFFSGSLLALTFIKPQMVLPVTAYLLLWSFAQWRTRRQFVAGFVVMSALLGAASLLLWPHWISEWFRVMFAYTRYSTPPLICFVLGDWLGSGLGPILVAALLAGALALAWRMRHASPGSIEFALTISWLLVTTAVTLLPGHAVYDHVILLPGIILIALSWRGFPASSRIFRAVLGVAALAVFWPWLCAPVVIALRPILSPPVFVSAVQTLPIRTAASIPFGVLALLTLMMRQVTSRKTHDVAND